MRLSIQAELNKKLADPRLYYVEVTVYNGQQVGCRLWQAGQDRNTTRREHRYFRTPIPVSRVEADRLLRELRAGADLSQLIPRTNIRRKFKPKHPGLFKTSIKRSGNFEWVIKQYRPNFVDEIQNSSL